MHKVNFTIIGFVSAICLLIYMNLMILGKINSLVSTVSMSEIIEQEILDLVDEISDTSGEYGTLTLDHVKFILTINNSIDEYTAYKIISSVNSAAEEYKVKADIILGLMRVESTFYTKAKSNKGAIGLMQINPSVWAEISDNGKDLISAGLITSKRDLFLIETNIRSGTYILRVYLDEASQKNIYNKYKYALTRYLGGKVNDHFDKTMTVVKQIRTFNAKEVKNG